jgi:hypothetical protein
MMDYKAMADRLGQFRQAQVPGGGQRPMNGWGQRAQGMFGPMAQGMGQAQGAFNGAMNRVQGMMPHTGMFPGGGTGNGPHNPMGQPSQVPMGQGVMGAFKRFGQ